MFLYDEQANLPAATIYESTQSAFYAIDNEGAIRAGLAQYAHGGGGLALHGAGCRGGALLYYKNSGSLNFYDNEGRTHCRFLVRTRIIIEILLHKRDDMGVLTYFLL